MQYASFPTVHTWLTDGAMPAGFIREPANGELVNQLHINRAEFRCVGCFNM